MVEKVIFYDKDHERETPSFNSCGKEIDEMVRMGVFSPVLIYTINTNEDLRNNSLEDKSVLETLKNVPEGNVLIIAELKREPETWSLERFCWKYGVMYLRYKHSTAKTI